MAFRSHLTALSVIAIVALVAHGASAQLLQARGRVADKWGNPLEGVQIEAVREAGGGNNQSGVTDKKGDFQMVGLASGVYEFTYALAGYRGARQSREIRRDTRPTRVELQVLPVGGRFGETTEFEADGGTPAFKFDADGLFEFEDDDGEGEGTYGIVELNVLMVVRDYDGPDDKYSISQPVVMTAPSDQFRSVTWNGTALSMK